MDCGPHSVILLAGGTSRRFGGAGDDKLDAMLDGATVLERTVAALPHEWPIVAVGPRRDLVTSRRAPDTVTWVRENPPFGGPAAAVVAALAVVTTPWCAVVAGDTPGAGPLVQRLFDVARNGGLLGASRPVDGVTPLLAGRTQPLLSIYRADALREAAGALTSPRGMSMRALLEPLDLVEVDAAQLGHVAQGAHDIDTVADLDAHRALAGVARTGVDERRGTTAPIA